MTTILNLFLKLYVLTIIEFILVVVILYRFISKDIYKRSRENVLEFTNMIFKNIMSEKLGDIDYTEEEYLNLGADYETLENGVGNAELYLIDTKKESSDDNGFEETEEEISFEENDEEISSDVLNQIDKHKYYIT